MPRQDPISSNEKPYVPNLIPSDNQDDQEVAQGGLGPLLTRLADKASNWFHANEQQIASGIDALPDDKKKELAEDLDQANQFLQSKLNPDKKPAKLYVTGSLPTVNFYMSAANAFMENFKTVSDAQSHVGAMVASINQESQAVNDALMKAMTVLEGKFPTGNTQDDNTKTQKISTQISVLTSQQQAASSSASGMIGMHTQLLSTFAQAGSTDASGLSQLLQTLTSLIQAANPNY